jgi:hypothetical protein
MPEGQGCPRCGAFLNSQGVCPKCGKAESRRDHDLPRPLRFLAALTSVGVLAVLAVLAVLIVLWMIPAVNQAVRQTFVDWFGP